MTRESLTILVTQARAMLDRQWDAFESQDRKIAGLFALATGLVTVVPTVVSTFGDGGIGWKLIPFAASAMAYAIGLPLHWLAYKPSEVHLIGNARAYYDGWMGFSEEDVLRWTLFDLAAQQEANDELLAEKQQRLGQASAAVALEAIFLVAGVLTVIV